ncbi:MAG TPA: RidA family protein [Gryllotalpicola sp.]
MTSDRIDPVVVPSAGRPPSPYLAVRRFGGVLYLNGQLPYVDGALPASGVVGDTVDVEQAAECARVAAHGVLGVLEREVGLDRVNAILRVTVYVASAPGFTEQPAVANAASAVLVDALGERGRHARSAIGVAALPKGAPVEVEVTAAFDERAR